MRQAFPDAVIFDNFDNKKGRVTIQCNEGVITPGVPPRPIRLPDGEYDTSICKRYDVIMKGLVALEAEAAVGHLFIFP